MQRQTPSVLERARCLARLETRILNKLQHPVLLLIRLIWGWGIFQAGYGKLANIDRPIGFFTDLGIPFPTLNAYLAATVECVGGLFLLIGLLSRLAAIPLAFTMIVALLTAHIDEARQLFSNPDAFFGAAPFLFLYAFVIILAFGPGDISVDRILAWKLGVKPEESPEGKG